ncbi:DUF4397 domain-containing protein [Longispora sp. NPDC051575]|uniref:DUF4397 domain-containing protein n=1 Tax=Longispora sp. NPDC051575 TaxID=3154943 RepID=UPI00341B428A
MRATRLVVATLAVAAAALTGAAPAQAASVGYVRLAHLSPDTPAVDVYLSSVGGGITPKVFPAVGYGVLSTYMPLPAGTYAVAMRGAGSPATSTPVLSTSVEVGGGAAYTVAGVGRYADLGLRVITDDLSRPDAGARIRVIHASVRAPQLTVATTDGQKVADAVAFASTSPYAQTRPGRATLRLQGAGTAPTTVDVDLDARSVYSLVVLDGVGDGLSTVLRLDARGDEATPNGAVEAGGGGSAGTPWRTYALLAGGAALVAAGLFVWMRSRRRPAAVPR